jgi:uncharacterized Zn-binding protein involved in type VI secretion
MSGLARVGVDKAGGKITGNLAPTVFVNGVPVAVKGAEVERHGRGIHLGSPTMEEASVDVFANGIGVCRTGDRASCGHETSGSENVLTGLYLNPGPGRFGVSKFGTVSIG